MLNLFFLDIKICTSKSCPTFGVHIKIDFTDYKAFPMDPVNYYEYEQTNYDKYDELVETLRLSELELAILNCSMQGMHQTAVCAELGIGRGTIYHRKTSIRRRYYDYYGAL